MQQRGHSQNTFANRGQGGVLLSVMICDKGGAGSIGTRRSQFINFILIFFLQATNRLCVGGLALMALYLLGVSPKM